MGAPIGGKCFLEISDKKSLKIHDWCGGPPAWETSGLSFAIRIWTRNFFGTNQRLGIVTVGQKEQKIFSKTFSVLDLRSFDKNMIYGYDSPIHKTKTVNFDIEKERLEKIIKLV